MAFDPNDGDGERLSDNRVRFLVALVLLVLALLTALALWPSDHAGMPSRLVAGGSRGPERPADQGQGQAAAGNPTGTTPDGDAQPGATPRPGGEGDLANLTVDGLATRSGFNPALTAGQTMASPAPSPGASPALASPAGAAPTGTAPTGTAPELTSATVAAGGVASPEVPEELAPLIKVMGEYEAAGNAPALLAIAVDQRAARPARAMALHALRRFPGSRDVLDGLRTLITSTAEDFRVRELALGSLVDIDGEAFQRFFETEALTLGRATIPDKATGELLLLAAYLDVTRYDGRAMRTLWAVLKPLQGSSRFADALVSFRLRLKDEVPDATTVARCEGTDDLVVLSNYVENLRRRAATEKAAEQKLSDWAAYHRLPAVRKLAGTALRALRSS